MATPVDPNTITRFYPILQPLLTRIQDMVPEGQSTQNLQKRALQDIAHSNTAEGDEFKHKLSGSLKQQMDRYIDISHRLNDYNEIYNTNKYIESNLDSEKSKMSHLNRQLKTKIFGAKQTAQMYEYERDKLSFYKRLFFVTAFVVIDFLVITGFHMGGAISGKLFYTLMGGLATLYVVIVSILLYANSFRTHTDWNKFYWASMKHDNNAQTCK